MLSKDECRQTLTETLNGFCRTYYTTYGHSRESALQLKLQAVALINFSCAVQIIDTHELLGMRRWIQDWGNEDLAKCYSLNVLDRLAREVDD